MDSGKGDEVAVGCEDSFTYLVDLKTQVIAVTQCDFLCCIWSCILNLLVHAPYFHACLKPQALIGVFSPPDAVSSILLRPSLSVPGVSQAIGRTFIPRDVSGIRPRRHLDGHGFV